MKNSTKKFGLRYLEKFGFTKGEGLGKNKDGISEPIILSRKSNQSNMLSKFKNEKHIPIHLKSDFSSKLNQHIKNNSNSATVSKNKDIDRLNNILNSSYIKRDYYAKMKSLNLKELKKEYDKLSSVITKHKELKPKTLIKYKIKREVLFNIISLKSNND